VPVLVFLGLSVLDLGPMYVTYRQTADVHHCLMPPTLGAGHNKMAKFKSFFFFPFSLLCLLITFVGWIPQSRLL